MRTLLFTLLGILAFQNSFSQNQPKIMNYPFEGHSVSLFIMPFTDDNPLKIGTVTKTGEMVFDFPSDFEVPDDERNSISSELWYTLFPKCDNGMDIIAPENNMFSFKAGYISLLTEEDRYAGLLFPVSDESLAPWMEDASYNDAAPGSYYELIYVASPFQYTGQCTASEMTGEGDVSVNYSYQLDLKAGFNFLKIQIEGVQKTDPNERAAFPNKITVSNTDGIPDCLWFGKYF
ncbi:MAG: hypothetical protein R2821_12645 [Flavobacteriaceae bacterium]